MKKYILGKTIFSLIVLLLLITDIGYGQIKADDKVTRDIILEIIEIDHGMVNPKHRLYFRLYNDGFVEYENIIEDKNSPAEYKWITEAKQINKETLQNFELLINSTNFKRAKSRYGRRSSVVDDYTIILKPI